MSVDELREAHNRLRREAMRSRREFAKSPEGSFARTMQDAMHEYHAMRAQAVSRDDACKGLEAVLRAVWPKPTSKFTAACELCQDTGWMPRTCSHDLRCGRRICAMQHPAFEHPYVEPCGCEKGDRFRRRTLEPNDPDDSFAQAARGRAKKRKTGFSRF